MENLPIHQLEAKRSALLRQLRRGGPLIDGSLATSNRKCGTPSCRCHQADEYRHRQVMLCKKVKGRSHATHIPKDLEEEVRAWNDEYKRIKELLKDTSAISEQIIRRHVQERKAKRQAAKALKLVDSRSKGGSGQ